MQNFFFKMKQLQQKMETKWGGEMKKEKLASALIVERTVLDN